MQAGLDDVHARVAQGAGDDLDAAVVPIEANLGKENANGGAHRAVRGIGGILNTVYDRRSFEDGTRAVNPRSVP